MKRVGVALLIAIAGMVGAGSAAAETSVQKAWVRATAGSGEVTAGYASIGNDGAKPDRLLSVSTPDAGQAELHESKSVDGRMTMQPVGTLTIPAGGSVELKAGGQHLMLTRLKHPLKAGDSVQLTFLFEVQGPVQVTASVLPLNAQAYPGEAAKPEAPAPDHAGHGHEHKAR